MSRALVAAEAPPRIYRVARRPDPWAFPDWSYAHADGTFGNRYDDPRGLYRVVYACTQRVGAFIETLARFRPSTEVIAGLRRIKTDDADGLPPGHLDVAAWVSPRRIGSCRLIGRYADVGHSRSLDYLNSTLARQLAARGIRELDAELIRTADRSLTMLISRAVYEAQIDGEYFGGIMYRSRLGDEIHNWAIFEGGEARFDRTANRSIEPTDPDLRAAAATLGITLV